MKTDELKVALAQMAPVWLHRQHTLEKVLAYAENAASQNCDLIAFGEALTPGYPFWISLTNGAQFNSSVQKELHAWYQEQAVQIEAGHLTDLCHLAKDKKIAVYLGCIERPKERGGHSLYCSLVYIDSEGIIQSVHRKLMPTYEERLAWSTGDGHGLRVHSLKSFTIGGLNCWENWMPLARSALYAQGENLHVAVWPGGQHNTRDITRFIAMESRSFVVSVSGLLRKTDIPEDIPHHELIRKNAPDILADGGSCIAGPDGEWIIEPQLHEERLFTAVLNLQNVREERQNFDPSGHYARPDVVRLKVNQKRQIPIDWEDE